MSYQGLIVIHYHNPQHFSFTLFTKHLGNNNRACGKRQDRAARDVAISEISINLVLLTKANDIHQWHGKGTTIIRESNRLLAEYYSF